MKKRGFTLIELLAVIVILAIIALIATPIVMNVIENARKGAAERSAENYLDAVETAVVEARMDNITASGVYTIMEDGNLCQGAVIGTTCDGTKLTVEVSGNKPEAGGTVKIENGSVVADGDTAMTIGDYTVSYNEEGKLEASKSEDTENGIMYTLEYIQGQTEENIIKYDPVADAKCETAGEGTCYSWYVLEDGDLTTLTDGRIAHSGEVSLIMNQNITDNSVWLSQYDFDNSDYVLPDSIKNNEECVRGSICLTSEAGPITANGILKGETTDKGWVVDVDLPTYNQVAVVDNADWLYEKIDGSNTRGYWTSTPYTLASYYFAYTVSPEYEMDNVQMPSGTGIRPIITISKDKL